MRGAALIVLGRDHPDFVREFGGNGFEHGEAGRVDTVVVRQKHSRHFGFVGGHRGKLLLVDKETERSLSGYRGSRGASGEAAHIRYGCLAAMQRFIGGF
jgi:hypothetical protein